MSMTVWAGRGDTIRFDNLNCGTKDEEERISSELILGSIHEVERVVVYNDNTEVYLRIGRQIRGPFNSVFFEDINVDEERATNRYNYAQSCDRSVYDTRGGEYGRL